MSSFLRSRNRAARNLLATATIIIATVLAATGCSGSDNALRAAQLSMKQQCFQAGVAARARWIQDYPSEKFSGYPQYAYNERLNTCLYADSYTDAGPPGYMPGFPLVTSREVRFVADAYTNRVLVEYTDHDGAATDGSISLAEFEAKKRTLMGR